MPGYVDPVVASASLVPNGYGFFRHLVETFTINLSGSSPVVITLSTVPPKAKLIRVSIKVSMSGYASDQGYMFYVETNPLFGSSYDWYQAVSFWGSATYAHHFILPITSAGTFNLGFNQMGTGPWGFASANGRMVGFYEG